MAFAFKKVDTPADDLTWLGSKHAVGDARTVTIDGSDFTKYKDGYIPSGIALTETGGGRAVPATDPQKVSGFLLTQQRHDEGNLVVPMVWHCAVKPERAPEQDVDVAAISSPLISVWGVAPTGGNGGAEGNG